MDMAVNKARQDDMPGHVVLQMAGIGAHADDQTLGHGNIAPAQLVGKDVEIDGVFQHQVGGAAAGGHIDDVLLFQTFAADFSRVALCHGKASFLL